MIKYYNWQRYSCDLQIDVGPTGQNKGNNITIDKKQILHCEKQMLRLGSHNFTIVFRKELRIINHQIELLAKHQIELRPTVINSN